MKKAHIVVHGLVQGVSFRYYTDKQARTLGLRGWVRNRPDGTVEIEAVGTDTMLDNLVVWCKKEGSPASRVDRVEVEVTHTDPVGGHTAFNIRH